MIDPFLVEGMRRGEKVVYIVDPLHQDEHHARLASDKWHPLTVMRAEKSFGLRAGGRGQETDKRRAKDASFDAHLVKPVSMAELEEAIQPPD